MATLLPYFLTSFALAQLSVPKFHTGSKPPPHIRRQSRADGQRLFQVTSVETELALIADHSLLKKVGQRILSLQ
jgi:hypothetical protein